MEFSSLQAVVFGSDLEGSAARKDQMMAIRRIAARGAARVTTVFVLVGLVAALAPAAGAIPPDPIVPDPIEGIQPPFEGPANGFDWWVPSRFNRWSGAWRAWGSTSVPSSRWETYDPAYVFPTDFPMSFDGCPTAEEAEKADAGEPTHYTYVWEVGGSVTSQHDCRYSRTFHAQGSYPAKLTIKDGATVVLGSPFEQTVRVKDILIVTLGDSYASGEGNPDVPQVTDWPWVVQSPDWIDDRCHRSSAAGPTRAAQMIENADPKTSVTYLSFACSGATVDTSYFSKADDLDPYDPDTSSVSTGSGVLGPYAGAADPADPTEPPVPTNKVPSQIDQLRTAITASDGTVRPVDAVTLSGGGNDIGFGPLAVICVLYGPHCQDNQVGPSGNEIPLRDRFAADVAALPDKYAALADRLEGLGITGDHVYVTEYPDPTTDQDGNLCPEILEDVIPRLSWWQLLDPLVPWWVTVLSNVVPFHIAGDEVQWAHDVVLPGLNGAVETAAAANGWRFVGGIAERFAGHGYCSRQSWIRRAADSTELQGPYPAIVNNNTKGTLHPTDQGHAVYRDQLYQAMVPNLDLGSGAAVLPPSFHASTVNGATNAVLGDNGWMLDPAVLTIEATTVTSAFDPNGILGASLAVNAVNGCVTGLVCTASLVDPQTYRWTFQATADGVYRIDTAASDWDGRSSAFAYELRADLHDPTAAASVASEQDPTGGWYRTPVEVTLSGSDPGAGSGLRGIEYELDGGAPTLVGTGEIVTVADDGEHTIEYRALDWAGRSSGWQSASFSIDAAAPSVTCDAPDGQWHAGDVTVACAAEDALSGLSDPTDAALLLATSVVSGTETADAATGSRSVCDLAGNCAQAGPVTGNRIDERPPDVDISTPFDGGAYTLGQVVSAGYGCADGGSGVAACAGTIDGISVADGAALPTGVVGEHTLTVIGTDLVGNRTTIAHSYSVFPTLGGPVDPPPAVNVANAGSKIPVTFGLGGDYGLTIFDTGYPKSVAVPCESGGPRDAIEETTSSTSGLRYDAEANRYSYVWATQRGWAGTCRQFVMGFAPGVPNFGGGKIVFLFKFR